MTTVVMRSMARAPVSFGRSGDFDGDVRRIRESVEHGGALLGLGDQRLDLLPRRVRVDGERHLDVVVAVTDVAVGTKDPADVVPAFDRGLDRAELDAAVLRDGRNTPSQAARQADEEVLDRRDAVVLRREDLGVVGFECPLFLVVLLLPKAEVALDLDRAVHATLPLGRRAPGELGGLRRALQYLACVEQCLHVDTVGDCSHVAIPPFPNVSLWRWLTIHWSGRATIAPMAEPASTLAAGSVSSAGTVGTAETRYLDLPEPVRLDCGRELHQVRVAYETYGALSPRRDNVILVCHALSGDAHAAGFAKTPPEESTRDGFAAEDRDGVARRGLGWWDGMIGPGKAFDTDRFFVGSTNLLGGCRGTTGPSSFDPATGKPYGLDFPVITVADMVRTERAFLNALGIERLAAVAGGSLGGMQAFEWAILFPDQVDAVVSIASTHALHPQGVAWNAIARDAIMRDPAWQGGHYYGTGAAPDAGLGVARMVGHVTYLSALALGDKFGRRLQFADDIRYTITEPEFEVESYLRHQADSFVRRFDANTYLYMSRALTYFDLARQYGRGSLAQALEDVSARTLLIAFSSDWLYPPSASREVEEALRALGKPVEFHMIEAPDRKST